MSQQRADVLKSESLTRNCYLCSYHLSDPLTSVCVFVCLCLFTGTQEAAVGSSDREGPGQGVWELCGPQRWHCPVRPLHSDWSAMSEDQPEQ